jgi:hypothetical protein
VGSNTKGRGQALGCQKARRVWKLFECDLRSSRGIQAVLDTSTDSVEVAQGLRYYDVTVADLIEDHF